MRISLACRAGCTWFAEFALRAFRSVTRQRARSLALLTGLALLATVGLAGPPASAAPNRAVGAAHAASDSRRPKKKRPKPKPPAPTPPPRNPSTGSSGWIPANSVNFVPLSDSAAAADVVPAPENRPLNTTANDDMPTSAQLQAFYGAIDYWGRHVVAVDPYYQYVTGHYTGTTDEIIQWAAAKWGIPADWLRAQYAQESWWRQSQLGDEATVSRSVYNLYPAQARVAGTTEVYESMGLSQVKWMPSGLDGAGTEPMRWESTAFSADYEAATIRFYFDDPQGLRTAWGDPTYSAGNPWDSLGGWYESYPWLNPGQLKYIGEVQNQLATQPWTQPGF